MGLKVFVSSEMDTKKDKSRRQTARKAIKDAGLIPIMFEDFSGRPFEEYEESAIDPCIEAVKESDIFVLIVDDDYSSGMEDEHITAIDCLGYDRIFYYFTENWNRNSAIKRLREQAKRKAIVKDFSTNTQLRKFITQSFSHYIKEKIKKQTGPQIIIDEKIKLKSGEEMEYPFWFEKDEEYILTIIADGPVYAAFVDRKNYVRRKKEFWTGGFQFAFGTDKSKYDMEKKIKKTDDYYLVIRNSLLEFVNHIHVRMRKKS